MKKTMFIIGIVLLGVLVLGGVVFAASGFSWTNVENALANLIYNGEFSGVGAHGSTQKGYAYTSIGAQTSGYRTTSIYNGSGAEREIDKIIYFASTTADSVTSNVHYAIGTTANLATIDLLASTTINTNANTWDSTSTFTNTQLRRWPTGTYINCYVHLAITTTAGFCGVEYFNP